MKPLVDSHIDNLKPYVPGKPVEELERELGITDSIKLASNENPLGTSPRVLEVLRKLADQCHIYPDGAAFNLKSGLASHHGVDVAELAVGNGSNELLTLVARTFGRSGHDHAVISACSFAAYQIILQSHNIEFESVPMQDGLVFDLQAMVEAVNADTKLIYVANPNNPTGTYVPAGELRAFLRAVPPHVVVVVDEAYHDYVTADDYESAEAMRDERERLLICRTFSKCYGLAGLRIGYMIGPVKLIEMVNRVREPFNSNLLAQAAALAALDDTDFVARSIEVNEEGRGVFEEGLSQLESLGVSWIPSQTNFLLVRTPQSATVVYDAMLRRGVIVRPMTGYGLPRDLRITIGTRDQMERCLTVLRDVLTELDV